MGKSCVSKMEEDSYERSETFNGEVIINKVKTNKQTKNILIKN